MALHKLFILTLTLGLVAGTAAGQGFEITPFIGYQFGGQFEDRYDEDADPIDAELDEGSSYGAILDIGVVRGFQVELLYSRQETELEPGRFFDGEPRPRPEMTVEYYHVGGLYQWTYGNVRPYVAASLGATRFSPEAFDDEARFSVGLGGGVKLMFNEHVGLRLDSRIYSTFIEDDEVVYWDEYHYYVYEDEINLYQFDVKGGLVLAF
jgi:hypothetical protein